jgi:hypothetical protein
VANAQQGRHDAHAWPALLEMADGPGWSWLVWPVGQAQVLPREFYDPLLEFKGWFIAVKNWP